MTDKQIEKVIKDIKDLKIQGNTNIAKTVAKTLLDYITNTKVEHFAELLQNLKKYGYDLANARQNEPLAFNAVTFILNNLNKIDNIETLRTTVIDRIGSFFKYIDESYEIIRINAVNLLRGNKIYFTHCHSSLSTEVLIRLAQEDKEILIINDETRPRYQGRITAEKLSKAKVNLLHTVDSAVASIFLDKRYPKPETVVVGSDGISINGDLVNKVGTFNIALAAKKAEVPFYVVTQSMKADSRISEHGLEIEQRDSDEIWKDRPNNIEILNPSFDLVPAEYITGGYITEKGLIKPEEFKHLL